MTTLKGLYIRGKKYWFRYSHNGHQQRINLQTEDLSEALKKALEIRANPELCAAETISIEAKAYAEKNFALKKFSARSRDETIRVISDFLSFSQVRNLQSITTGEIQRWYEWLKTERVREQRNQIVAAPPLSEVSAQTYVARLSGFLGYLVSINKLRENAAEKVKMGKLVPVSRRIFCKFEIRDALIASCTRPDIKYVLYAGFHAGLRKGEIIESNASWFDLEQNVIHVPVTKFWMPKGKKSRDIPLTKEFKKFLLSTEPFKTSMATGQGYMLHPNKKLGSYRYRWDFRKPFDQLVQSESLNWVTPHVMRKTFASLLVSSGTSLFKVASWLGDDIRTTQNNYAYLLPKDNEIEKAFARRRKTPRKPKKTSATGSIDKIKKSKGKIRRC